MRRLSVKIKNKLKKKQEPELKLPSSSSSISVPVCKISLENKYYISLSEIMEMNEYSLSPSSRNECFSDWEGIQNEKIYVS